MATDLDIPVLERPDFFDGQRLAAADLRAVHQYHEQLRWLHNRALHNWGIAAGFEVIGLRGEKVVRVRGGYALDCRGREILLAAEVEMAVPAVAGPTAFYLTAAYESDEGIEPQTRRGPCEASGAVRRADAPKLRWQNPDDASADPRFERGIHVVLASVEVTDCRLAKDVSAAGRRDAQPATQPYVAAGQTPPGETPWSLWRAGDVATGAVVGVKVQVPTTAAGFRTTPRYQAHVLGDRAFKDGAVDSVVDGYAAIGSPTALAFELRVALPGGTIPGAPALQLNPVAVRTEGFLGRLTSELNWHVVWTGVEG